MIGSQGSIVASYLTFGSNSDLGNRLGAVGGEVDRLVGLDVVCREMVAPLELRPRSDAAGQFQVVSDVEELDQVVVIAAELNKRVGPRGDNTAAKLQCLGNRAGGGLPDFEIR